MKIPANSFSSRLNSFKSCPELFDWKYGINDIRDLIRRADKVSGIDSIIINYPEHLIGMEIAQVQEVISKTHLKVGGLNIRFPVKFIKGAFTNPDPGIRQEAVELTCRAADVCRQLGGEEVICWPEYDGFDYPMQMDYQQAWKWEIEGMRKFVTYAPDIHISIEYKPCEPRKFSLLCDIGTTLLALKDCGMPKNLGVTLDFCHMLMARENPAYSAALCISQDRLFGLHFNDGYGMADDGLMIGSVNFWQTVELLYVMAKSEFQGVIYFDTFPLPMDPVRECESNLRRVKQIFSIIEKIDENELTKALEQQDVLLSSEILWKAGFER